MIDLRSGYVLNFIFIARKYCSSHIRSLILGVHDKVGLPDVGFYFENGVWKARKIVGVESDLHADWKVTETGLSGEPLNLRFRHARKIELLINDVDESDIAAERAEVNAEFDKRLLDLNRVYFTQLTNEAAQKGLAAWLASICNEAGRLFTGPWYFPGLIAALLEFMEEFAKEICARLAKTEVAAQIFDALNFAWSQGEWVRIEGDSRFGKTESIETWTAMRPGLARLVKVPCSNAEADLHRAFAEALGMEVDNVSPGPELRRRIE